MSARLSYVVTEAGISFTVESVSQQISPDSWAAVHPILPNDQQAVVAPLLRRWEGEQIEESNGRLVVPHEVIAQFSATELLHVGLPPAYPFTLQIRGTGILTDDNFAYEYRFVSKPGRSMFPKSRQGAIIDFHRDTYTLIDPLYTLVHDIDEIRGYATSTREQRFTVWSKIKQILPENVLVDDYLKLINIVQVDAFTLIPFRNDRGEYDFDPKPVRKKRSTQASLFDADEPSFETAMTQQQQESYSKQFRKLSNARTQYALSGGAYLVIPEQLKNALEVARRVQEQSSEIRQQFYTNPRVFLKNQLEEEIPEEEIESLFFESDEYSDRVRDIGIWEKPELPQITQEVTDWIPNLSYTEGLESLPGELSSAQAQVLLDKVKAAIAEGTSSVNFDGREVPATAETVDALEKIIDKSSPGQGDCQLEEEQQKSLDKIVLKIDQNLFEVTYRKNPRKISGEISDSPFGLLSTLLDHQLVGLTWLKNHWHSGTTGALLADDMGLGKTMQALAFLKWIRVQMEREMTPERPILIVAPTGLLKNWIDEHDKHLESPGLGYVVRAFEDGLRDLKVGRSDSRELTDGIPQLRVDLLRDASWVLASYETLRDYQHSFSRVHWSVIVFDETQKIKNPATQLSVAAKAMNADFTIAMTGTPVENRLMDLWNIMDRLQPGLLGSLNDFSYSFEKPVSEGATGNLEQLKSLLTTETKPPVLMRRMKEDHLTGLPEKRVNRIDQEMPAIQAKAYQGIVSGFHDAITESAFLAALQGLRKVSLHPTCQHLGDDEEFINASARLSTTMMLLDEIASRGEKALIFLEYLDMQSLMAEIIQRRYGLTSPVLIINGGVNASRRKDRVDQFQNRPGFDVMILSPRAGGVGLTLTAANNVIHLSRWWNPAVEDQCSDRVYRIGQHRTVNIHLPLAIHPEFKTSSFDLRLHELLSRKRALSSNLLAPPAESRNDLEYLFNAAVKDVGTAN